MADISFTFPFTAATLIVALASYVLVTPIVTSKLGKKGRAALWLGFAILFGAVFTVGYALRFLLGVAVMAASRLRINKTGVLKEVLLLVIALVLALLFVGLR